MRRIRQFLLWRSNWWTAQVGRRGGKVDDLQLEGDKAYALRQADLQRRLGEAFGTTWADLPALITAGRAGAVSEALASESEEEEEEDGWDLNDEDPVPEGSRPVKTTYID